MSVTLAVAEGWKLVERPPALFRRFEFASYSETRAFLDALARLSEETGRYPDLGFGTKHVNVTLHVADAGGPAEEEIAFANGAAALAGGCASQSST